MPIEEKLDRSRCVFCDGPNDCALAQGDGKSEDPCWCFEASFPVDLLAAATAKDGGARCVCRSCLERGPTESGS